MTAPLGAVAEHLAALAATLAAIPGGEQLADLRKGVAAQLGFDVLTREGLVSAGIDPLRGAAVAVIEAQPRPEWVLAVPLSNRAGFTPSAQQPAGATLFERGASAQKLALGVVRGYGMLARGADPAALLSARTAEASLASSVAAVKQKLGAQDFIAWAPGGSELPRRYLSRPLPSDVALSVQGSSHGLALRILIPLPPADAARATAAIPGGGASLVELLPADAPVRARLGVAPAQLLEFVRGERRVAALLDKLQGVPDVFAAVQPGAAFSLSVAKNASLAQAIDYGLDFARKSPFDTVQLIALAKASDKARLVKALEAIAKQLPALGMKVVHAGDDFQTTYAAGLGARFGVREIDGAPVGYLLGGDLKPEDLHRAPAAVEVAALGQDAGAVVRADFGKLASAIHALPESTFGTGPQSYVTRSVVGQVIEPLRPLRLTLTLQAQPESLNATLDLEVAPP